jgi:hypothetical protein
MPAIRIAAITFASVFLSTADAHADGTWCANYVLHTNCGFHSLEQCQATVSGAGGFCYRNTFGGSAGPNVTEPRRDRRDR